MHGSPHAPHRPHLIRSEILKGLKFKQQSGDQHHTRFRKFLTPGVALDIVDAFAKFKECGFTPKTIA